MPADGTGDLHGTRRNRTQISSKKSRRPQNEKQAPQPAACSRNRWDHSWSLACLLLFTLVSGTKQQTAQPQLTADDLEQQKYDAHQQENEQLKAAQLRNEGFLVRKDEDTTLQLNNLMKDLQKDDRVPRSTPQIPSENPRKKRRLLSASSVTLGQKAADSPPPRGLDRRVGATRECNNEAPQGSPQPMFIYKPNFWRGQVR